METATAVAELTSVIRPLATQVALNERTVSADALQVSQILGFLSGIAGWSFFLFWVWRGWKFIQWAWYSLVRWVIARRRAMQIS